RSRNRRERHGPRRRSLARSVAADRDRQRQVEHARPGPFRACRADGPNKSIARSCESYTQAHLGGAARLRFVCADSVLGTGCISDMADRFDKFTERARKVLQLAQEEAQRFNHNYIGTEHLLLGLVREGEGVAAKVLGNLGVELNKVRSAVEFIIGRGDRTVAGDIGLTPRAKKVIELSVDEARRLNHHYIGTEHLLLGLVREGEGIAAGVLESLGVSLDKVRSQVIYVLNQSAAYQQE